MFVGKGHVCGDTTCGEGRAANRNFSRLDFIARHSTVGPSPPMQTSLTSRPASDPLRLYHYRDGLYAVDLLTAAIVEFDFFTRFAPEGMTPEEVCAAFGFAARPADVLLTLCAANDFIVGENGRWHLTLTAREHLCAGSHWNLTPYFSSLHDRPIARDFAEATGCSMRCSCTTGCKRTTCR